MINARLIDLVIATCLGNPFDVSLQDGREADAALAVLDIGAALEQLVEAGEVERAKMLILATGHRRACAHPEEPEQVFDKAVFPASVGQRMPRPLHDYRRIVMAAGRCHRALASMRGSSWSLQRARRETWAACFGNSLRHALDLEPVIRDHDILLLGETGTGKEGFARAIQVATPGVADGKPAPHAAINAAAMPDTLVESELFGHIKGAFTGATEARSGRLRLADGGSFFLDEVGDLPSTTQVKLLRVIETNEVYPLGADIPHIVDVRYIAATHKNIESLVTEGMFRRDLFERLAGNVIYIPPLRERPEDIIEIAMPFVRQYLRGTLGRDQLPHLQDWLTSAEALCYRWPGNVRELQNVLRNLLLGLPPGLKQVAKPVKTPRHAGTIPPGIANAQATLQVVDDWYMRRVLDRTDGNLSQAAKILGVDRSTIRRRLGTAVS